MDQSEDKYIVIERNTNRYLHVGAVFYKTEDIKEASIFKSRKNAEDKIKRECIHYIVDYQIIKMPKKRK